MAKPELKKIAIELRQNERLSVKQVARKLGIAQSTASLWLRQFPLTDEEKRMKNAIRKPRVRMEDAAPAVNITPEAPSLGAQAILEAVKW
jgi:transposase-like protein